MRKVTEENGPVEYVETGFGGRDAVWLALWTIVGCGLRGGILARGGLFCDEGQAVWIALTPWRDMFVFLYDHEWHPPIFYIMIRLWCGVWGWSEASVEGLALVLGTLVIPAVFATGWCLYGRRGAWAGAALSAAFPPLVAFSAMVRSYGMLPLWGMAVLAGLWRGLTRGGRRWWALCGVGGWGMLLSHNWGFPALAGVGSAAALVWFVQMDNPRVTPGGAGFCRWAAPLTLVLMILAYLPWAPGFWEQTQHGGYHSAGRPDFFHVMRVLGMLGLGVFAPPVLAQICGWVYLGFLGVIACCILRRRYGRERTLEETEGVWGTSAACLFCGGAGLASLGAAWVMSSHSNLFHPGSMSLIVPWLLLGIVGACDRLGLTKSIIGISGFAALIAFYLLSYASERGAIRSNARETAWELRVMVGPEDRILIVPQWLASPVNFHGGFFENAIPYPKADYRGAVDYDRASSRYRDPETFAKLMESLRSAHAEKRRIWWVTDRDLDPAAAPYATDAELPEFYLHRGYDEVASIRCRQIRDWLVAHYGPPAAVGARDERPGLEHLRWYRFDPPTKE